MRRDIRHASHSPSLILACLFGALGCLTPVDPADAPVANVQVTFEGGTGTDTIPVRGTTRVRAAAVAREGNELSRADFSFTSSDTTVAQVDANGIVRGRAAGTARITAALPEGARGEATIV